MPSVGESFAAFFDEWLVRQHSFLENLLASSLLPEGVDSEGAHKRLIEQVLAHYQQYYEEKAMAAKQDVFIWFSQPWLSSFERTLLWVTGFKPSMVFRLVGGSAGQLSAEQAERVEQVRAGSRREEREIERAMARIHESVAEQPLFGVMIRVDMEEEAVEALKASMVAVVGDADALRGFTVRKVLEILSPIQSVKFFVAAAELQLQTRRWGLQRGSERKHVGPT